MGYFLTAPKGLFLLHLDQMKAVAGKKGGGNSDCVGDTTGRTAAFQKNACYYLALGQQKGLFCPFDELWADIHSVAGYHSGPA